MTHPTIKLGIVGVGKIVRDQHLPSIDNNEQFTLQATASRNASVDGVKAFQTIDDLLADSDVDALSLCVPPQFRHPMAVLALEAGKHVLLEKPPGATINEVDHLREVAAASGVSLYASWHSRHAVAVATAKEWLASRRIKAVVLTWKEDVRRWHPSQEWIWQAGGLGVFDAAINGLSILTECFTEPIFIKSSELLIPKNKQAPIAARLEMQSVSGSKVSGVFDWDVSEDERAIDFHTNDGLLRLHKDGAKLSLDGKEFDIAPAGRYSEYEGVYARFAKLINAQQSDVDLVPFKLVADAFINGKPISADAYFEFE